MRRPFSFQLSLRCQEDGPRPGWRALTYNGPVKQLVLDLIPPPSPTFDNFVPGRNSEARAYLCETVREAAPVQHVVYLWGASGSGKTHLLRALAAAQPGFVLRTGSLEDLPPGQHHHLVDQVEKLDDAGQVALFHLINRAQAAGGRVVATGPVAPRDLPLRPELTSRLGSGMVFQLQPLDDQEKAAALRAHAAARGFTLRDEVTAYLLRHARRDMASLISFLDALDQYSLETGREITLPLLREMSQPSLV